MDGIATEEGCRGAGITAEERCRSGWAWDRGEGGDCGDQDRYGDGGRGGGEDRRSAGAVVGSRIGFGWDGRPHVVGTKCWVGTIDRG